MMNTLRYTQLTQTHIVVAEKASNLLLILLPHAYYCLIQFSWP